MAEGSPEQLQVQILTSYGDVGAEEWDALVEVAANV